MGSGENDVISYILSLEGQDVQRSSVVKFHKF